MKVLIATDGRAAAQHAIEAAIRLLAMATADVHLVSVTNPENRFGGNLNADDDLAEGSAILRAAGIEATSVKRTGDFVEELLAEAEAWSADVIVLGSSSRGQLARWFGGSVSNELLHRWKGALLVVNQG